MTVRDAIEQAYRNGYEAGVKSVTDNNVGGKWIPVWRKSITWATVLITLGMCSTGFRNILKSLIRTQMSSPTQTASGL